MNRRAFLQSILATAVSPWVCTTAGVLMPVRRIERRDPSYFWRTHWDNVDQAKVMFPDEEDYLTCTIAGDAQYNTSYKYTRIGNVVYVESAPMVLR